MMIEMTSYAPDAPVVSDSVVYRPGALTDVYTQFLVFEHSLADLSRRLGLDTPTSAASETALAQMWLERQTLYEHLSETANQCWLAEQDGRIVGFARSVVRDGLQQLTELFVLPGAQSGGIGRELLRRAFPAVSARLRSIIASPDVRAQALYLKAGVYPRFPIYYFGRRPQVRHWHSDLDFVPVGEANAGIEDTLAALDLKLLDHRRDVDHRWWLRDRQGYLYVRRGEPVGYGYVGRRNGPFLLLDDGDFPAVLAHAETRSAIEGHSKFGLEVPMVNRAAIDTLLARGFHMDAFIAMMMTDQPFGSFENYIHFNPPFIL